MPRILVVDDDEYIRNLLNSFLSDNGFDVTASSNAEEGLEQIKREAFDIILADMVMPGMSGIDLVKKVLDLGINIPIIIITAHGTIGLAVDAMKAGAFDYIIKPLNMGELLLSINRALESSKLKHENILLKKQIKNRYDFQKVFIGDSPPMQKVFDFIQKVADTDSTILIYGESGTGKELVAKTIHYNSSRSEMPFVPLNCAAIPNELLETELFGHEKGAFSGAINTRLGRFELANKGTLFLDEIGDLHPSLQSKLLRVLQEREFERVGGTKTIKVDVRIIAATNKNLEDAVSNGKFREDLYYRLNVISIHLPPLRERKEDIYLLIRHFMKNFSKKNKKDIPKISHDVMQCLVNYHWPGNVRELENLIERFVILNDSGVITMDDLPERFYTVRNKTINDPKEYTNMISVNGNPFNINLTLPDEGIDLNKILVDIEKNLIVQAMQKAGGVKKRAADLLKINRTTLLEKMKRIQ